MAGGGWAQGWGYGSRATLNMSLPALATLTAKNLDLINDTAAPYQYPLESAENMIHFTWPSLQSMDDRDLIHSGGGYTTPNGTTVTALSAILTAWSSSLAPQFHAYAHAIRTSASEADPWENMLFWDPNATEAADSTLPTSFFATGMNDVAMRSDWSATATWASFRASAYVSDWNVEEENHDAGGLAIIKGGTPFLPNPTGAMCTTYPDNSSQPNEDLVYGNGDTPERQYENIFFNGADGQDTDPVDGSPVPGTKVSIYEDAGTDVRVRGANLADVYSSGISAWTRDIVYVRPNQFVVFDRTTLSTVTDPYIAWHLFLTPTQSGSIFDVSGTKAGYIGRMTSLLPANPKIATADPLGDGKVTRITIRSQSPTAQTDFLTVFDAASSAAAAYTASVIPSSSDVTGALLASGSTANIVIFGNSPTLAASSGAVTFTAPTGTASVVVTDLVGSATYDISDSEASGHHITVQAGSAHAATANGTLHFSITASGGITVP